MLHVGVPVEAKVNIQYYTDQHYKGTAEVKDKR